MATIFPERLPESIVNDPLRSAERRVYDALSKLDNKYTVYYSVAWQSRNRHSGVYDGEADFVIAHPDLGVLVIEVKGGRISYDAHLSQWYSTDRKNNRHEIKDPAQQALNSAKTLLRKFQDLPRWGRNWLTIGHAVIFPDSIVDVASLKLDLPSDILIPADKMGSVPQAIRAIFEYYARKDGTGGKLGYKRQEMLDNLLAKSFKLSTPLGVELAQEDAHLITLTEQQMGILDVLHNHPRAAIQGCAGSGKTMLALQKAKHLVNQGFDVLLTCFNNALATDLVEKTEGDFSILHFHGLCRHFADKASIPLINSEGANQKFYNERMPDVLLEAIDELGTQFDAIVVDEGQDFRDTWWLPLFSLLRDSQNGIFLVLTDFVVVI